MKGIVFHSEAEAEFDDAIAYYEECLAGLGLDFKTRVESAVRQMCEHPERFAFLRKSDFRAARLKRFPYSVIYLEQPDMVWVAAIAHSRRHPDYWKKRRLT